MSKRSRLQNSEHLIGGVKYFLTRVSDAHSKWKFNGKTFPSHAAAVRAVNDLKAKQIEKNRVAFQADTTRRNTPTPQVAKLTRSLPPTEGTGQPDTRPLMQQALEDLSDSDLVQLVKDRRVFEELWSSCEDQLEAYAPAKFLTPDITLQQIIELDHGGLYAAAGRGYGGDDLAAWIMDNNHTDARKEIVEKGDFTLAEVATIVANLVDATGAPDVASALKGFLELDHGDLTYAHLALEKISLKDKEYFCEQFKREVLNG